MTFKYRFVPVWPAVFSELRHDVEVIIHRADGSAVETLSTAEVHPGDFIESSDPITGGGDSTDTHPFLVLVDSIPDPPVVAAVTATTEAPQFAVGPPVELPQVVAPPEPLTEPTASADTQEN